MSKKTLEIGLAGLGCVGTGLYEVLGKSRGLQVNIRRICVKDRHKSRPVAPHLLTYNIADLLNDPQIDVLVELIDDADAAFEMVSEALKRGKSVVTANKKMLAEHLPVLLELQRQSGAALLYEGASCASIPVVRNLEEYFDNDLLVSIEAIVNGSTNYMLTLIEQQGLSFADALTLAQQRGFAESNPHLDISGEDAANKLVILLTHAFGRVVRRNEIPYAGIDQLSERVWQYAQQQGGTIKLVAEARHLGHGVTACVWPTLVLPGHELAHIRHEFNAVVTQSSFADRQTFIGKGAGAFPTASAVLSDLSALTYGYRYEYKKMEQGAIPHFSTEAEVEVLVAWEQKAPDIKRLFSDISGEYRAGQAGYITGSLHLYLLADSSWQEGLSILRLPGELRPLRVDANPMEECLLA